MGRWRCEEVEVKPCECMAAAAGGAHSTPLEPNCRYRNPRCRHTTSCKHIIAMIVFLRDMVPLDPVNIDICTKKKAMQIYHHVGKIYLRLRKHITSHEWRNVKSFLPVLPLGLLLRFVASADIPSCRQDAPTTAQAHHFNWIARLKIVPSDASARLATAYAC